MRAPLLVSILWVLISPTAGIGSVRAEPFQIQIRGEVAAPGRPALVLSAIEPLQGVSLWLRPQPAPAGEPGAATPETTPVRLSVATLPAGQSRSFPIGTGRIGRTVWTGILQYIASGRPGRHELRFETLVTPTLTVRYDAEHLNLKERWVEVQLSQPAARAEVRVFSEDGTEMGSGQADFAAAPAGTWLRIPWREQVPGNVLRLELRLVDRSGFPVRLTLWPWSVPVPHEEVRFDTGSYEIRPGERAKLDDSYARITAILDKIRDKLQPGQVVKLFVIGHTDTVDSDSYNLTLSRNRARAIAAYLRQRGLRIPIHYAGCGERQLRVQTADNVDEERNRRVDYVLAFDPPRLVPGVSFQALP
ncbi:MAG: OmpA family protein [Myxococcales bacterium]|nr:OmpA family protein [Myxococcota bacterium]MDW8281950.1 OmpA family protein [Myxococcales bacterium]